MGRVPSAFSWVFIAVFIAATGFAYNFIFAGPAHPAIAVVYALFCGMPLVAFERGAILPRLYHWMHRLPTPVYVIVALVLDFILISVGFAAAGTVLKSVGLMSATWSEVTMLPARVLIYALTMTAILILVLRVRELLGRDIFLSLLTARYRKPVAEERVFLFVDLVGSTSFAEEFGDLRAQQYLASLFSDFARSVRRHKGAIDDYVGDAAIITWPMARGVKDARCVRCIFDIFDDIKTHEAMWLQTYGRVPQLRASLHGGPIITAEIGVDHHKITYFGDTVNTAARLESLCKVLDKRILMSTDLARRMTLPGNVLAEDLGEHAVKGRDQTVGVVALRGLGEETSVAPLGRNERFRSSVRTAPA
ncbi:adenylate/guanylate cyclase domain-containing protein [Rhizobium sp. BK376]|jgi:adenylate cyclase|uniref:adenylate/guanylate cyclase domain-containing protein n=1 Tax=Rhizobium sp. BK376 TaxID=2512149 RepID=UPI0010479550|nr:adenylate/guanylate cyclase domain-containing protein [Rhizobium sp. BK376]TCR92968.1 adenylate cyclase [Rhizobium sp. BK376]